MIEKFRESFEKTRIAGTIAAGALDEVSKIAKIICRIEKINFDDFSINDLYPGLIKFEKND